MISFRALLLLACFVLGTIGDKYHRRSSGKSIDIQETNWNRMAQESVRKALNLKRLTGRAKNLILFIGDGMGISTTAVARIYKAQEINKPVHEVKLAWEAMPHSALAKTYSSDYQTSDSAATATALYSGVKTRQTLIGLNEKVSPKKCNTQAGNELKNIFDYAREEKKWTGMITTTRLTHATPASAFAYSCHRDWESDDKQKDANLTEAEMRKCPDIAKYLVHERNKDMRVWLGGGRRYFRNASIEDEEYPNTFGRRLSGNLIEDWKQKFEKQKGKYVWNLKQFKEMDPKNTDYLLGLFEPDHMKFEAQRKRETGNEEKREPSVKEMVEKSIKLLERNNEGYVLVVEGGRIDHAHHNNLAAYSVLDTLALNEAVEAAEALTKEEETLIIVTSDHSHTFSLGGYATMKNPVLGVNDGWVDGWIAEDKLNYTNVGYANGPGFMHPNTRNGDYNATRKNPVNEDVLDEDYAHDSLVPLDSETHGGEDVGIYAKGPMAHLFHTTHEQHYIPHVAMRALCIGPYKNDCKKPVNSATILKIHQYITILPVLLLILKYLN